MSPNKRYAIFQFAHAAMRLIAAVAGVALLVALMTGLLGYTRVFNVALGVFVISVLILCLWVYLRHPELALDCNLDVDEDAPQLNISAAEQELRRKDRGVVPKCRASVSQTTAPAPRR